MHYIRFLKSPRIVGVGSERALVAKITVTTDLGESFLAADVGILVDFIAEDGESLLGPGREYLWKGRDGMRSLEVSLLMQRMRKVPIVRMVVAAKGEPQVDSFEGVLASKSQGGIVTVRSMDIDVQSGQATGTGMAERVFSSSLRSDGTEVHIWEETGESIARHVWDAGLVLSSYIASLPYLSTSPASLDTLPRLPLLGTTLSNPGLNILELGAGCGIVGITLLHTLPKPHTILLTDLLEATSILTQNLTPSILRLPSSKHATISHQVLDWSLPLPSNVSPTKWDLVVVADCTYNPDVVPDLVKTLREVAEGNREAVVLLAMKVRHESEMVFFELMEEKGFVVREKCVLALPVLGREGEVIEVFVFGYRGGRLEGKNV